MSLKWFIIDDKMTEILLHVLILQSNLLAALDKHYTKRGDTCILWLFILCTVFYVLVSANI